MNVNCGLYHFYLLPSHYRLLGMKQGKHKLTVYATKKRRFHLEMVLLMEETTVSSDY